MHFKMKSLVSSGKVCCIDTISIMFSSKSESTLLKVQNLTWNLSFATAGHKVTVQHSSNGNHEGDRQALAAGLSSPHICISVWPLWKPSTRACPWLSRELLWFGSNQIKTNPKPEQTLHVASGEAFLAAFNVTGTSGLSSPTKREMLNTGWCDPCLISKDQRNFPPNPPVMVNKLKRTQFTQATVDGTVLFLADICLCSILWDLTCRAAGSPGVPAQGGSRGDKGDVLWGMEHLSLGQGWACSAWRGEGSGRIYCHMGFQYFKGAHNKDGTKLSIRACCNRTKAKVLSWNRLNID